MAVFISFWDGRREGNVVETFSPFSHDAAPDKPFQRTQCASILGCHKTDGVTDRLCSSGASNAMDIILRVHREIVIHHVRDPIHIDAARGDVGGDEDTDGAGFEILQCAEPLVLRAIGMDGSRFNSTAFETASDLVGATLSPGKNENSVELLIAQEMKQ